MNAQKKKNSRERRVLTGALVIAGVMIAGSTFAWFTSEDEVTNRLTASADYNVAIVESFEPPANWIPGQVVNKDVYAVNTGNISAFTKEEVSGVLTITHEKPVDDFDANCIQLTAAERYVVEAGAYLAWKPASSGAQLGRKVVSMTPEASNLDQYASAVTGAGTDFTPDTDGLYVFRRSIVVDNAMGETFEYEGYYYKDGKFYKVAELEVTEDSIPDFANDGNDTDGQLSTTEPTFKFLENVSEVVTPNLAYDEANNRLVATYETGVTPNNSLEALAQAYDEAFREWERANEAEQRALNDANGPNGTSGTNADLTAAKNALDTAYTAWQNALSDQRAAQTAYNTAQTAKTNADNAKNAAQAAVNASKTRLYGSATGTAETATTGSLAKSYADAQYEKEHAESNSRTQFEKDFVEWASTNGIYKDGSTTEKETDYKNYTYNQFIQFPDSALTYNYAYLVAKEKLAKEAYDAELAKLYGTDNTDGTPLAEAKASATSLWGVLLTAETNQTTASAHFTTASGNLADKNTALQNAKNDYDDKLAAYNAALNASNVDTTDLAAAQAALSRAEAKLNAAQAAYNAANQSGVGTSSSLLTIYIQLADTVVPAADGTFNKWQILPATVANNKAEFYYTGILEPSETSTKLIESVELDKMTTKEMYKSFDFDLNVSLKSVQVAYDKDNETILETPAEDELGASVTLSDPKNLNTALAWSAASAPNPDPGQTPDP